MVTRKIAAVAALALGSFGAGATPAAAFTPLQPACGVAGIANPAAGHACRTVAGGVVKAGAQPATGQVGGAS